MNRPAATLAIMVFLGAIAIVAWNLPLKRDPALLDSTANARKLGEVGKPLQLVVSKAAVEEKSPDSAQAATPASILTKHGTFKDGFREASIVLGPGDPDLLSAAMDAAAMCAELPDEAALQDPSSGLMVGFEEPDKIWAIERLETWCDGFDGKALMTRLGRSHAQVMKGFRAGTPSEQLEYATAHARSKITYEMQLVGMTLLGKNLLPLRDIFGKTKPPPIYEQYRAWLLAASLSRCTQQLGCGPNSPNTIAYCAEVGCSQGLSYQGAIRESAPPRAYAAVLAFERWMQTNP